LPRIRNQLGEMFDHDVLPTLMKEAKLGSQRELEAHLVARGTTLELCRESFVEIVMAQQWLHQQVKPNESIGHNDMLAYYHDHVAEMETSPSRACWEHLMVKKSTPNAKERLGAMGNRVIDGQPLAEVAKAESQGPGASSGGQQGWIGRGSLASAALDKAIFSLPVGVLSPILEDEQGYHIVRVLDRQESVLKPFEKVHDEIRKKIKEQREADAKEAFLLKLRQQIPVRTVYDGKESGLNAGATPSR